MINFYKKWKAKKADKARREQIINNEDYLIRLRRSYRTFCGMQHSTVDDTLTMTEITDLMYAELERRTGN